MGGGGATKAHGELMAVDGCQGRENNFSLGMCLPAGSSCPSGWPQNRYVLLKN